MVVGNKVRTVLSIVNEKRESDPMCTVAYHDMEPNASGEPGDFLLTLKHNVFFVPDVLAGKKDTEEMTQMSIGAAVPVTTWMEAKTVSLLWCVKWSVTGLSPVRPLVVTKAEIQLAPGRALQIT